MPFGAGFGAVENAIDRNVPVTVPPPAGTLMISVPFLILLWNGVCLAVLSVVCKV